MNMNITIVMTVATRVYSPLNCDSSKLISKVTFHALNIFNNTSLMFYYLNKLALKSFVKILER